jgi:hypothetical protein
MKNVTFFTKNILDGIEYADNFKFRQEDNYFKNDLIFLKGLKDFFDIYGIKYETYNGSNASVDYAYLAWTDDLSLKISDLTDRWYPKAVTEKLIRKDMMPEYLKRFGFNCLDTRQINSVDDVSGNNFIIKPIIGTSGKNIIFIGLPDRRFHKFKEPIFSYRSYATVSAFLNDIDLDISQFRKKFDTIFENIDPRNKYCIQRACMSSQYEIYTIYGVVNSDSDVYFTRAGSTIWKNFREHVSDNKRFYNEIPENQFIRNFIKSEKIRNASFGLQLIRMEDNLLYPIDWNFRIQPRPPAINNRIEELYKQLCHMYDIENDLPETWSDVWYMQHSPKKYNRIER